MPARAGRFPSMLHGATVSSVDAADAASALAAAAALRDSEAFLLWSMMNSYVVMLLR